LRKSTQPGAAEKEFREAIAILAELTEKSPTVAGLQWNLARSLSNLGAVFQSEQKGDEAEATYRKSLDRLRHLADDYPSVPDYQYELAVVYDNLGWALGSKLPEQAEGDFRKALEIEAKLVERFPERPDYRRQLAATRRNLGILRTMSNRPKEAEEAFRSAVGELDRLVTEYPKVPEYQSALGVAQDVLAALLSMGQKWGECRPLLEQAIRHQRTALELQPQNQDYRRFLKKDYEYLELTLRMLADHTASAKAAKDLAQLFPDDAEALRRAGRLLAQAAQLAAQDPQLPEPERVALSRSYGNLAIERLQAAIAKGFSAVEELQDPVYSSIRDREAFRKLQDDLQARTKVHVG
jgi:tetratricopeptide (TPR) repeat protein